MFKKLIALTMLLVLVLGVSVVAYGNDGGPLEPARLPITLPICVNCQCEDNQCDDDEQ